MANSSSRSRSDSTLVDHGESNAWLSRTHFSRSVCYRFNGSTFPCLSVPLLQEANADASFSNSRKGYTKLGITQDDVSKDYFRSFNSPEQDLEPSRVSTSASTSPIHAGAVTPRKSRQYLRSLSLGCGMDHMASNGDVGMPSNEDADAFYDCARAALEEGDLGETKVDNGESDVARAVSWSEYLDVQGNECAVEEAEDWMIDLSELYLGHKFASGAYSRLYLGKYQNSEVAVKILRQPDDNEEISMRLERQFRSEVSVLSQIHHHRNIIKFIGACRKPPVCCIITEYLALGSVRTYLHNQSPFSLSIKTVVDMALDIAQGMEYLHSQGIIHRDLKSENLLITNDLCVKITDFGVACFESDITTMTNDVGTYRWMAPEMIKSKHCSRKTDVYSFGIVVWELLTGHTPFEDLSPIQAAFAVVHKHARPPLPLNCPSTLGLLMHQCWSTDPNKRPNFSKVVEVLKDMKECAQLGRNLSIFRRPHKHHHPFLHCFGFCASKDSLSPI